LAEIERSELNLAPAEQISVSMLISSISVRLGILTLIKIQITTHLDYDVEGFAGLPSAQGGHFASLVVGDVKRRAHAEDLGDTASGG
jgi:hypothetical protein